MLKAGVPLSVLLVSLVFAEVTRGKRSVLVEATMDLAFHFGLVGILLFPIFAYVARRTGQ
jgi:hypothetical protein